MLATYAFFILRISTLDLSPYSKHNRYLYRSSCEEQPIDFIGAYLRVMDSLDSVVSVHQGAESLD